MKNIHPMNVHEQANSKKPVQYTPGKTWQFQFKKHKRKIEVEIERKRVRKTGKWEDKPKIYKQGIKQKNNVRDKLKYLFI